MSKTTLEIGITEAARRGVYANLGLVKSSQTESIIDFMFFDESREEDGRPVKGGLLQSRIIMPHSALIELRDQLNQHIENNFEKVE